MDKSRGIKNVIFGLLSQLIILLMGLIIPRLVLVKLGSESNGLLNSVNSILSYLSLLEAGVGTAAIQALYRPCAEKDIKAINGIMSATDYFYRRTGKIYFVIVLVISIVYSIVIKTTLPRVDVFLVVLFSGLTGVISYFFQGKIKVFLSAEGKKYVTTNITLVIHIISSITKAILLVLGFNVVAIQLSVFIFNLLQVIAFVTYMKLKYSWMNYRSRPDFYALSQKNAVLLYQISGLIFYNTDTIILTIFTGLKEVSVYSMYALIFSLVKTIAVILYDSYEYALGQSYSNKERFMRMFNAYEVFSMSATFALFCIAKILVIPFLQLYTAGVSDINYLDEYLPWLFVIVYLLHIGRTSSATVIYIDQKFEATKWRAVLESVINITVSLIFVWKWGLYGVLLGTIVALLYRTNDMILYASRILKRPCWITYKRWFLNLTVFLLIDKLIGSIELSIHNYFQLIIVGSLLGIFIATLYLLLNVIFEQDVSRYGWNIIKNFLKNRFAKKR